MDPRKITVAITLAAALAGAAGGAGAAIPPKVWFVDNTAAPAGEGTPASPLATLAEAEERSRPGDWIFVHAGDGSTRGLDTGIRLNPDQALVGEGVGLEIGPVIPPGEAPSLTNPNGPGVVRSRPVGHLRYRRSSALRRAP